MSKVLIPCPRGRTQDFETRPLRRAPCRFPAKRVRGAVDPLDPVRRPIRAPPDPSAMLTTDQLQDMVTRIHRVAETHGVPIGHYAGDQCRLVDPGLPMSNASGNIGAIIEEVVGPPFPENGRRAPQEIVREVPRYARNQSHVTREAIGAGLNCGLMAISFVGVVASGAAAAPSGGSSLLAGAIAWTGLVTGSIQCGDSLSRLWVATQRPDSDSLDRADQNPIYSGYRRGVAGLGAAAGGAGLARGTLDHRSAKSRRDRTHCRRWRIDVEQRGRDAGQSGATARSPARRTSHRDHSLDPHR